MQNVLNDLSEKIEKAAQKIQGLQDTVRDLEAQNEKCRAETASLEQKIAELEKEAAGAKEFWEGKIASFSGQIGEIAKKLDNFI